MAKPKRCGIYARCSTTEQSTEAQIVALKDFATARGWAVTKIYEDTAFQAHRQKGLDSTPCGLIVASTGSTSA